MSHFTVLVTLPGGTAYTEEQFHETLENMLAPYSENRAVSPYEETCYCVGYLATLESVELADKTYGKSIENLRDEFHALPPSERPTWEAHIQPLLTLRKELVNKHPLANQANPSCEECHGKGKVLSTYNQNSKWDWYEVGGRWSDMLLTTDGRRTDVAQIKEIDFNGMKIEALEEALATWEEAKQVDETARFFRFGIEKDITKEAFLAKRTTFSTFAVVTADGNWHQRGQMGWFATVHKEEESELDWMQHFYERFIAPLDENTIIAIVDCHI